MSVSKKPDPIFELNPMSRRHATQLRDLAATQAPPSLQNLSPPGDPESFVGRLREVPVLLTESLPFAYFLGAHAANTESDIERSGRISLSSCEKLEVTLAASSLKEALQIESEPYRCEVSGVMLWRVTWVSKVLATHIERVSERNSRVPWEHIGTREEQRSFLRGLFDGLGSISVGCGSNGMILRKQGASLLLKEVAAMLYQFGVVGRYSETEGIPTFRINDQNDLQIFSDTIGLRSPRRAKRLKALLETVQQHQAATPESYYRVMERHHSLPVGHIRDCSDLSVSNHQVKSWVVKGLKPRSVQRLEALLELTKDLPNGIEICRRFRAGLSSSEAREGFL